ncbi:MAG: glycosyltransferase family 2 protein [Pseudomonadota bacterium]
MPHVAVCIITYRRPDGLKRLLASLSKLAFKKTESASVEVIVVDNDAEAPMRALVEAERSAFPWPITYDVEPQAGIPFARNRTLDNVSAKTDYIAFIDDDEEAEPQWLDELLWAAQTFGSNVVMGYVQTVYPENAPPWIVASPFFDWRQFQDGDELREGATSNALIAADLVRRLNLRFDERLGRNGGDDYLFFKRTQMAGETIIGSRGAVVRETHPESRLTQKWILQRRFRSGNSLALVDKILEPSVRRMGLRFVKGAGRIAYGLARLPINAFRGRTHMVMALGDMYWGAGSIAGVFGVNYEEYKTIHAVGDLAKPAADKRAAE